MVTGCFGMRIFEWQAVAVARVFAGRADLESVAKMEAWERERLASHGVGVTFWNLGPDFENYFEAYISPGPWMSSPESQTSG
jgi:hypothetical protein